VGVLQRQSREPLPQQKAFCQLVGLKPQKQAKRKREEKGLSQIPTMPD
jgi:hypothetical protein